MSLKVSIVLKHTLFKYLPSQAFSFCSITAIQLVALLYSLVEKVRSVAPMNLYKTLLNDREISEYCHTK